MTMTEFPLWIHPEVKEWAADVFQDAEPEDLEVQYLKLALLSQSEEMEKVWTEVTEMHPDTPEFGQHWLCSLMLDSIPVQGMSYASIKESEKWLSDLALALREAQKLLDKRPANLLTYTGSARRILLESCTADAADLEKAEQGPARRIAQTLLTRSSVSIEHLLAAIDDSATVYEPFSFTSKTGDNEAIRRYFIRSMTSGILHEFGEPKRRWLMALDRALFPDHFAKERKYDSENHRRSIQRLTRDLAA